MAHEQRFTSHPLCTCLSLTFDRLDVDRQPCRDRAATGVDPHPVLTAEDMRAVIAALKLPWSRVPRSTP